MGRWGVFCYCVFVLGILVGAAMFYLNGKLGFLIPDAIPMAAVAAAWAGALGGVAISFKGVFSHPYEPRGDNSDKSKWDNEWIPWHIGRPFTGLVAGIFVFIALKAVYPSGEPAEAVIAAAAFVLGTQETAFFQFVTKIGAIVVSTGPSDEKSTEPEIAKNDAEGEAGRPPSPRGT